MSLASNKLSQSVIVVEAFGDRWPFVILTVLCFVVLSLGLVIRYHFALPVHTHASVFGLLKEQKIFVTALIIFLANLPISALETGQPLWIGKPPGRPSRS